MSEQPATQESQQSLEDRAAAILLGDMEEPPEASPEPTEAEQAPAETEDQAQEQSEEAPASEEEVEFEGEKFKVPQKIKDALLRQSDYTRKTQEVAEARKVVAEQQELVQQQAQFHQTILDDLAQVRAIDAEIAKYAKLDWSQMDTDTLVRTRMSLDQLKEMRGQAQATVQQKAREFEQKRQQTLQQLVQAGLNVVKQRIPNFNDSTANELVSYGKSLGYTDVELSALYDPRQVETLWKASQWDKLQASKPDVTKRASQAAPVLKPGATDKKVDRGQFLKGKLKEAKSESEKRMWGEELLGRKLGL